MTKNSEIEKLIKDKIADRIAKSYGLVSKQIVNDIYRLIQANYISKEEVKQDLEGYFINAKGFRMTSAELFKKYNLNSNGQDEK